MRMPQKELNKMMRFQQQMRAKQKNNNIVTFEKIRHKSSSKKAEEYNKLRRKNFFGFKNKFLTAKPHNEAMIENRDEDDCLWWQGMVLDTKIVSSQESYILLGNLTSPYSKHHYEEYASHSWLRVQDIKLLAPINLTVGVGDLLVGRSEINFDKRNDVYKLADTEIISGGVLEIKGNDPTRKLRSNYDHQGDWVFSIKRSILESKTNRLSKDATDFIIDVKPSIYEHVGNKYLDEIISFKEPKATEKESEPHVVTKPIIVEARAKRLVNINTKGIIHSYVEVSDLRNKINYAPLDVDSRTVYLSLQQIGKIIHENAIISFSAKLQISSSDQVTKLIDVINPQLIIDTGITLDLPLKDSLRYGYVDYINLKHTPEMIQFDEWRKIAGISKLELAWESTSNLMTVNMIAYNQKVDYQKLSDVMNYIGFKNNGSENNKPIYDYEELKRQEKFEKVIAWMRKNPTPGYTLKELSVYLQTERNMLSDYLKQNVSLAGVKKTGFQIKLSDLHESLERLIKAIYISTDAKEVKQAIAKNRNQAPIVVILGKKYVKKTWVNQQQSVKITQSKPIKKSIKSTSRLVGMSNIPVKKNNENKHDASLKAKDHIKKLVTTTEDKVIVTVSIGQITQQVNQDLIDSRYYYKLTNSNIMTILDYLKVKPIKQLKIETSKDYFIRPVYNVEIVKNVEQYIRENQWNMEKLRYYDSFNSVQPVQERLDQLGTGVKVTPSTLKQWGKILGYHSDHYTYHDLGAIAAYGAVCSLGYKAFKLDDLAQLICYTTGDPNKEDLVQLKADIPAKLSALHIEYSRNLNISGHPLVTTRGGFIKVMQYYLPKVAIGNINQQNNPLLNMDQVLTETEMKTLMWTSHAVLANKVAPTNMASAIRHQIVGWIRNYRNLIDQHYYYRRSFIFLDNFAIQTILQSLQIKKNKPNKQQQTKQLSLKGVNVKSKAKKTLASQVKEYTPIKLVARLLVGVTPEEISNYLNIATHQNSPIVGHYQLSNNGEYLLDKKGIEIVKGRFKDSYLDVEKHLKNSKNIQVQESKLTPKIEPKPKPKSEIKAQIQSTNNCILLIKTDDGQTLYTDQFKNYDQAQAYLLSNKKQFISAFQNKNHSKLRHLINIRRIMDISPSEK